MQGVRDKRSATASIAKAKDLGKELDEFMRQVEDMAAEREDGYNRNVERFREEEYPMLRGWYGIISRETKTNLLQMRSISTMLGQPYTQSP